MHFIIHHPGKAGEVFLGLPMARLLKEHHPDCRITWVVLDLYRDSVGLYPYVDKVETIPTYSCRSLSDVSQHMSKHRFYVCKLNRSVEDPHGIHIDAYYNYIIHQTSPNRFKLARDPFYLHLFRNAVAFCPGADEVHSWKAPEWFPTEQAISDGEAFERQYGGGPVVIFSPYIADQSCVHDNQSDFEMEFIFNELRKANLPVIATGTRWDKKDLPEWVIDGYSPRLSLGGLYYLIKNRATCVVSPNSGVGFAAHWLGAPTLMIDNRTGWREQIEVWRKKVPHLDDGALPHERRWPPFIKENFQAKHMLNVPFEQIEWSKENFLEALHKIGRGVVTHAQLRNDTVVAATFQSDKLVHNALSQSRWHQSTAHAPNSPADIESTAAIQPVEAEVPRLVVFDITKRGDGTATGEIKATLFADWPGDRIVHFYSVGQDQIAVDGIIPTIMSTRFTLCSDDIANIVSKFDPDMILYRPVPDNLELHEAAMKLIRSSDLPLAIWIMDDWPSRLAAEDPALFTRLDADLRELLARAALRLSICDAMSAAFEERYGVSFKAFANAIDPDEWPTCKPVNTASRSFLLRYAGGLAPNMGLDSVLRTARVVEGLAREGNQISLEINTRPYWHQIAEPEFKNLQQTTFRTETLAPHAYRQWLMEADAVLICYNFDDLSKRYVQYSLANKLPECLASGAAILAHGPSGIATIDYLRSLDCVVVVTEDNDEVLAIALRSLVNDTNRRRELSSKARAIAFSSHNVQRVRRQLRAEFLTIARRKQLSIAEVKLPEYARTAQADVDEMQLVAVLLGTSSGTQRMLINVGTDLGASAGHFIENGWQIDLFRPGEFTESLLLNQMRIDILRLDAESANFDVLRGLPWDRIRPEVIACTFQVRDGAMGSSYQKMADILTSNGYVVYVSEWYPNIIDGKHEWCRIARYPQPVRTPNSWGTLLGFLRDPGTSSIAYTLGLCVRFHSAGSTVDSSDKAIKEDVVGGGPLSTFSQLQEKTNAIALPATETANRSQRDAVVPAQSTKGQIEEVVAYNSLFQIGGVAYRVALQHALPLIGLAFAIFILTIAPAYAPLWNYRIVCWIAAGGSLLLTLGTIACVALETNFRRLLQLQKNQFDNQVQQHHRYFSHRLSNIDSRLTNLDDDFHYSLEVQQIREVAISTLPRDVTVLVVSKGDDQLLRLGERIGWHFPQTKTGEYAGHYPADSTEAIEHLESLRTKNANFLVVPKSAYWWFDHYSDFKKHLDGHYLSVYTSDCCIIYSLSAVSADRESAVAIGSPQTAANPTADFAKLVAEMQRNFDRRLAALESKLIALDRDYRYMQTVRQIRDVVSNVLPSESTVLVVSKGDEEMLRLDGRQAWHFPQTEEGTYAGHHPADSAAAIAHLEELRFKGAKFLLVPATSFWWFHHYGEFKKHLDRHYRKTVASETCVIYRLTSLTGSE